MRALLATCALAFGGCVTTETHQLSSAPAPQVRVGARARMWDVQHEGELVGRVVLFQERGSARDSIYIVRNPYQQDLGLIDGLGRAYRYLPHREEPSWVGSGTIAQGAERILGLASACVLSELDEGENGPGPVPGPSLETSLPTASPAPAGAPLPDVGLPQSR